VNAPVRTPYHSGKAAHLQAAALFDTWMDLHRELLRIIRNSPKSTRQRRQRIEYHRRSRSRTRSRR